MTATQAALDWLQARADVIAIPKTADAQRQREHRAAADIELDAGQLAGLERLFPPPARRGPLPIAWRARRQSGRCRPERRWRLS